MRETKAGWYADPENSDSDRYWDGSLWTVQRRPHSRQSPPPTTELLVETSVVKSRIRMPLWLRISLPVSGFVILAVMLVIFVLQPAAQMDAQKSLAIEACRQAVPDALPSSTDVTISDLSTRTLKDVIQKSQTDAEKALSDARTKPGYSGIVVNGRIQSTDSNFSVVENDFACIVNYRNGKITGKPVPLIYKNGTTDLQ